MPSMAALARRIAFVFHLAALEEKAGLIEGAGDGGRAPNPYRHDGNHWRQRRA